MTASYETTLHEAGWEAAAYLKSRGIGKDVAESFRLGVVNDKYPEHAMYEGMLCIPYMTKLGGVVSLKFRRPHTCGDTCNHSKYISPYRVRMYNTVALDKADRAGYVCVTEGEFDAIILGSCGHPAVGIPGVECWGANPEWRCILAGFPRVFVFGDQDEPGRRLVGRVVSELGRNAVSVDIPEGGDVSDCYTRRGRDWFCGWVGGVVA